MNILLWVLQVLAALLYGSSGVMKVFMFDKVSQDVPSFGALPREAWMTPGHPRARVHAYPGSNNRLGGIDISHRNKQLKFDANDGSGICCQTAWHMTMSSVAEKSVFQTLNWMPQKAE
jgi:hypothetical protein